LIGGWKPFSVSLSIRILIINFIGRSNYFPFPLVLKDEEAIDWKEGFSTTSKDKGNKLKEGSWEALGWGKSFYFVFLEV